MKVALVSPPSHDFRFPAPGIAYLKGVLNQEGYESKAFDLNNAFIKKFGEGSIGWTNASIGGECKPEYKEFFLDYCNKLIGYDWIGVSLFSFNSQTATELLLSCIKELGIKSKIVIGGAGILRGPNNAKNKQNGDGQSTFWAQGMIDEGLSDYYIVGEGDKALPALLKGKAYRFSQMNDLSGLPYPDYSDFDLADYDQTLEDGTVDKALVTITSSRGCVRKCTFCSIGNIWGKYKFRPGEEVAAEMAHQYEKHGVDLFYFSDSLVNGSLKEFRKFCRIMSENDLPVEWMGQFIFRSGMTEEDWDYLKGSGCKSIWIGIESGSEKVRWHMKKKFDNRALYSSIKAAGERGIHMVYQTIVGYPTETEEDFQDTLKMIYKSAPYASNIIIRCHIALLIPGTQMFEETDWHGDDIMEWAVTDEDGEEIDLKTRIERWSRLITAAKSVGMGTCSSFEDVRNDNINKLVRIGGCDKLIETIRNL